MNIRELFEEIEMAENDDIQQYIIDYLLALKANKVNKISTSSVIQEVLKKSGIIIDFNILQKIVSKIPFVSDINEDILTLKVASSKSYDGDAKETVKDMAQMALRRRNK